MKTIQSAPELYAHAIAIEREAAERYSEFAERMADLGNDAVATPRRALEIALAAEKRAQAFFEGVMMTADDPALRALAQEMAMEEQGHVALVERLLERTPEPGVDWGALFEAD